MSSIGGIRRDDCTSRFLLKFRMVWITRSDGPSELISCDGLFS